jgi:murein DD-endopeptidase MepM/ murein hydrolase activator NlpD
MAGTLLERTIAWLRATFPERQIYIRSDGRVQFFTFGVGLQAAMATLSLVFLGWVAFASVNVIFKDRIIAAKDHRYQQMQATYENRVADLQLSYDELNGALVSAEDKFKSVADRLQAKQQAVANLLSRKDVLGAALSGVAAGSQGIRNAEDVPRATNAGAASDSIDAPGSGLTAPGDFTTGSSELSVMPQPVAPQPRTSRPTKASFLDDTVGKLAGAASFLFQRMARRDTAARSSPVAQRNPAFRILAEQTYRLIRMSDAENALLQAADSQISARIAGVQSVMRRVGVDPAKFEQDEAVGGPLIPMKDVRVDGIADPVFTSAYTGASAHGRELDALFEGLRHVPLTTPVHGGAFELTSDFGPRVDPFTHHVAFHSGLDFGGPWGSTVAATAPGTVVYAGPRGGYGNMVEVDHGYGIRTRYGHLSSILVRVGTRVAKGAPVGRLGSTGRSTGPHVHYEVWLANAVRDPSRFIEAGRHVQ